MKKVIIVIMVVFLTLSNCALIENLTFINISVMRDYPYDYTLNLNGEEVNVGNNLAQVGINIVELVVHGADGRDLSSSKETFLQLGYGEVAYSVGIDASISVEME